MSTTVAPDVVQLEDLDLNLELPCERFICNQQRPPAVWRVAPGIDHQCLTVQFWCDACRVSQTDHDAHLRDVLRLNLARLFCNVCGATLTEWKPFTYTPIRDESRP